MKLIVEQLILQTLRQLEAQGVLPAIPAFIEVFPTKSSNHGDYSTNVAMVLAKICQLSPTDIANLICTHLPNTPYVDRVMIAAPGFINFSLSTKAYQELLQAILSKKEMYGRSKIGRGKRILVEFLSSNPVGPLHIGHGRQAVFGAVLANLLDAVGFKCCREYYLHDTACVMDRLVISVWLRYLLLLGECFSFPMAGYQGDYVTNIAKAISSMHGRHFAAPLSLLMQQLLAKASDSSVSEESLTQLIDICKTLLGERYQVIYDLSLENILADIREDMAEFRIHYDDWYSERRLLSTGAVSAVVTRLNQEGYTYEQQGKLLLKTSLYGDEKDRALMDEQGRFTAFADDIAYHYAKFDRGFDIALDVFGVDHEGYVPRIRAAMRLLGIDAERLVSVVIQRVTLYRGNEKLHLSHRKGACPTLRAFREEVGDDAVKLIYLEKKHDHAIEFDVETLNETVSEHSVYYMQYAFTRINRLLEQGKDIVEVILQEESLSSIDCLVHPEEKNIMLWLADYPEVIKSAAMRYDPHSLVLYLNELAQRVHAYYAHNPIMSVDDTLKKARLTLISAIKQVMLNSFKILGIEARTSM